MVDIRSDSDRNGVVHRLGDLCAYQKRLDERCLGREIKNGVLKGIQTPGPETFPFRMTYCPSPKMPRDRSLATYFSHDSGPDKPEQQPEGRKPASPYLTGNCRGARNGYGNEK